MELQEIKITNYKSLVDLEIKNPNPFTVFAGPNGAGKSNIFEALEFASYDEKIRGKDTSIFFGGNDKIINFNTSTAAYSIEVEFPGYRMASKFFPNEDTGTFYQRDVINNSDSSNGENLLDNSEEFWRYKNKFLYNFTRLFINRDDLIRIPKNDEKKLLPDASNLASILKTIFLTGCKKEDFLDWIRLFIPGLSNIEVHTDNIGGTDSLLIFEKGTQKPFTKSLISDGTYNILALLTAVYQADEPQFLCIEEPENGLNPFVVESLVSFFRQQCEEKGHYIWLNTHSQTLVKHLSPHELILVDKKNGATTVKQFSTDYKLHGLEMDEAWLSNALGGGVVW